MTVRDIYLRMGKGVVSHSSFLALGLILFLPLWGVANVRVFVCLEVLAALMVFLHLVWIDRAKCIKKPSVIFFILVLLGITLGLYPLQALLACSGLLLGEWLASLNIPIEPISKIIVVIVIPGMVLFGLTSHVDPNFLSFYIACIFACSDWSRGENTLVKCILYVIMSAAVIVLLKSRAFAYASIIFFIVNSANLKIYKVKPAYVFILFIFIPLFVTYGITNIDGGVVKLYRSNEFGLYDAPSIVEKLQNVSDINRFRISRMWIEEYLANNPKIFFFGLGNNYPLIVERKNYFPVHNSFIELALYFGVPYLFAFIYCFSCSLSRLSIKNCSIWFLLSFGMVLHGVFYLTLIPFYYLLVNISSDHKICEPL